MVRCRSSAGLRCALADEIAEHHGDEQHHSHEDLEPVRAYAGEEDSLLHHAEDERPEERAHHRTVAPRQEHPADDGGGDGLKLQKLPAEYGGGTSIEHPYGGEPRPRERGAPEE